MKNARQTVNVIVLALLSSTEALQFLIVLALIYSFVPIHVNAFVKTLFPLSQYDVKPERESFFYHAWIAVSLGMQAVLLYLNRSRLGDKDLWQKYVPYVCTMAVFGGFQIFAVFKIFLWNNPWWARDLLYGAIVLGILARIFWPEIKKFIPGFMAPSLGKPVALPIKLGMDALILAGLIFLVFSPPLTEVLSRMFSYDKFYHTDSFIMAPAWAHHKGLVLNHDVTSEYSLIIPIFFDGLMQWMGGFSYAHAVMLMIALSALYYFLLYGLWRYWTKSFLLSVFGILLCIKLQFFHWGVVPLIWIYPSATPLRFLPDVFFLFFLLRFTQNLDLRWLWAASIATGIGLVWVADIGVYMYAALIMAAGFGLYLKGKKTRFSMVPLVLLPWAVAFSILYGFYGNLVLDGRFWHNTMEFADFFLQGWGTLPITEGLKDRQFFAFCMAFIIPTAYVATLLFSLGMVLFRREKTYLFMLIVCVYGLGLEHYFIHRSGVTSYYAVVVPTMFVLLFWIHQGLVLLKRYWQRMIKLFLCVWAFVGLTTGFLYLFYPNHFNLSAYDWGPEQRFYAQNFDFSKDAALIDTLTASQEAVPLISSFETKILMQADRKPFFYYFPFMESEHMQGEKQRNFYLHTYASLDQTIHDLQEKKPRYIFVQSRLIMGNLGTQYQNTHPGFQQLMAYIGSHYQYQTHGEYLVALKLKL